MAADRVLSLCGGEPGQEERENQSANDGFHGSREYIIDGSMFLKALFAILLFAQDAPEHARELVIFRTLGGSEIEMDADVLEWRKK